MPSGSSAGFICLILLRSLLLDFPCATAATQAPATPIGPDRLFLNVRSVGRMARPPYCPPVPSPACFIRLILLQSLTLDLPCATPAALHRWFSKLHSLPPLTPSVTVAALHGLAAARNRSGAAAGTRNDGSTWTHRDCVFDQPPWRRLDSPPPGLAAEAASAPVYSH